MISVFKFYFLALLLCQENVFCTARAARKSTSGALKSSKSTKNSSKGSSSSIRRAKNSKSDIVEAEKTGITVEDYDKDADEVKGSEGYKISVITWNLAEKSPSKKDYLFLSNYRDDDIVVVGAQECEDVRPRREEGHRSKAWRKLMNSSLGKSFTCVANHKMGGLQIAVFVKKNVAGRIQGTQILDVACGVGNVLTNKGAVCVLLRMGGKTLALINAHLAAHVGKVCLLCVYGSIFIILIPFVLLSASPSSSSSSSPSSSSPSPHTSISPSTSSVYFLHKNLCRLY